MFFETVNRIWRMSFLPVGLCGVSLCGAGARDLSESVCARNWLRHVVVPAPIEQSAGRADVSDHEARFGPARGRCWK